MKGWLAVNAALYAPRWLTRFWCDRFGHPERRRLQMGICCDTPECQEVHVVLECCGLCYRVTKEVESA